MLNYSQWKKSPVSGGNNDCVEARLVKGGVEIRDSKDPEGGTLTFTNSEWDAFVAGAKNGEFDIPQR